VHSHNKVRARRPTFSPKNKVRFRTCGTTV